MSPELEHDVFAPTQHKTPSFRPRPKGPRAGIYNPRPVVMDSGLATSLRYVAPRNDDSALAQIGERE